MSCGTEEERGGADISTWSNAFIYTSLKDRFRKNPPSPRTAILADALLSSSEALVFQKEMQGYENEKTTMVNSNATFLSCAAKAGGRGGKIINGKGSRIPAGNYVEASLKGRRIWSAQEDNYIRNLVNIHGTGSWTLVADCLASQYGISGRTGKQCWERWHNHLDPMIRKDAWTEVEERVMSEAHKELGNKWSEISKRLPGRTDNHVKNHWYSFMRKNVRRVTHEVNGPKPRVANIYDGNTMAKPDNEVRTIPGPSKRPNEKNETLETMPLNIYQLPSKLYSLPSRQIAKASSPTAATLKKVAPKAKRRKAASLAELQRYYQAAMDAMEEVTDHPDLNESPSRKLAHELSKGDKSFVEKIRKRLGAQDASKEANKGVKNTAKIKKEIKGNGPETPSTILKASKKRRRKDRILRSNKRSHIGKKKQFKDQRSGTSTKRSRGLPLHETGIDVGLTVEVEDYNYNEDDANLPSTAVNTANTDASNELGYNDSSLSIGACILSGIRSGQSSRELPSSDDTKKHSGFSFPSFEAHINNRPLKKFRSDMTPTTKLVT